MDSLLVNLRKYRPRENTDPLENFVTEAFAWLLRSSPDVQQAVVSLINELLEVPVAIPNEDIHISTQENFAGKYPDLVVSWPGCTWVFEHKVWSELHNNQIKNYRDYIAEHSDDYRMILITAKTYQHAQDPDAALCWQDIYKCLTELKGKASDEQLKWALNEFLTLLKTEGLGLSTPINRFSMTHYLEAMKFDSQVDTVFQQAQHSDWPLQTLGINPLFKRQKTESRVGLQFCPEIGEHGRLWLPGIFCGVLLHGSDHGVSEFLNDELHLCVVFDVNSDGQEYIKDSKTYQAFKSKFQAVIENEMKDWCFVDAATDPKAKYNRWHPIILLKPMLTVFEHTHTHQEQVDLITDVFGEIQSNLVELEEFKLLVSELATSKEE